MSLQNLAANADIIERKLAALKDQMFRQQLSKGQRLFIHAYLVESAECIDKCLDVLNFDRYQEMLIELEE